ncbi:hypothetical protein CAEBREN_31785 [Caenorhabditis brenneri]|uniref:Uncharacterized protein n=1 Tax=Caenorhabditis brenneri TaxID=135651 RepID=G0NRD5_CAEBE|nr:hypothetical protein CAEBREN_31785 [Caenorhabditis brenneri]
MSFLNDERFYQNNFYQNFNGSLFGDINFYISCIISMGCNGVLIKVVKKIKSYKAPVKYSMYSMALLRIMFSVSMALTCPLLPYCPQIFPARTSFDPTKSQRFQSILYSRNANSLYIMKNGINFPNSIGYVFLSLFVAFMVMSCSGPALQYLQVSYLLSLNHTKDTKKYITVVPIFVVITSLALIFFGYIPPFYKIRISSLVRKILEEQGDTPFLIITVRLVSFIYTIIIYQRLKED